VFSYRYTLRTYARETVIVLIAIGFCVPAYVLAILSLKTTAQTYLSPLSFPTSAHLNNYSTAWAQAGRSGMGGALKSSAIITVTSVICLLILGSMCGYALARRTSRLSTGLYVLFVLGIILPFQLAIIPLFTILRKLDLTGTYSGMILFYVGQLMPFTVFLYTGFIRALPKDYEEAAEVDGAGFIRTWLRVVVPLLGPVTGTVAVLAGLYVWNDFFVPLVFLSGSGKETLAVALYSFVSTSTTQWNLIMAGVVISIAPVLAFYIFAQRQLMRGFGGGIRG
jgi:raffinose/stachyose/melibiose transport system permease protein